MQQNDLQYCLTFQSFAVPIRASRVLAVRKKHEITFSQYQWNHLMDTSGAACPAVHLKHESQDSSVGFTPMATTAQLVHNYAKLERTAAICGAADQTHRIEVLFCFFAHRSGRIQPPSRPLCRCTPYQRKERAIEVSCSRLVVIRIEAFYGKCGILDHEEIVQQDLCNRTRIFASVRRRFNAVATKRDSN